MVRVMKKFPFIVLCFFLSTALNAQLIKSIGIKAGGTVSQHNFEYMSTPYAYTDSPQSIQAINVGVFAEFLNDPVFSIVGELNYVRKGAGMDIWLTDIMHPDGTGSATRIKTEFDYLNISALGKVRLESPICTPYLLFGPKLDFEINRSGWYPGVADMNEINQLRFGFKAGIGTEIKLFGIHFLAEAVYDKDLGYIYDSKTLRVPTYSIDLRGGAFINL